MYEGIRQASGGWGCIDTYGPKIVENIVQAVARDCLAESMFRLDELGYRIVFHVHDELICEIPIHANVSPKEISGVMSFPIAWAKDLPLTADAYECEYYRKE
jgi:DNA polymerase